MDSKQTGNGNKANSNKPKNAQKPDFLEIKDQALVDKVFKAAYQYKLGVTLWIKDQALKFDTKIIDINLESKKLYFALPEAVNSVHFIDEIKAKNATHIFGTLIVDKLNFFFKIAFTRKTETNLIQVEIPASIFKLQRRSNLRISLHRGNTTKVYILNPECNLLPEDMAKSVDLRFKTIEQLVKEKIYLEYRMLDISAGGIGLAAPVEDKAKYAMGQVLHNVKFKLKGVDITSKGTIRYIKEAVNDRNKPILKIGIQFLELRSQFEQAITQFVMDESRTMFSML